MYTNKTKVWLVALAASFVGLSACNNEDLPEKSETTNSEYVIVEGTGERITLDLSGQADLEAFGIQSEEARYAIANKSEDPRTTPVINLDDEVGPGNAKRLLLRLVNKAEPNKITEIDVPKEKLLFEGKEGAYTFNLKVELNLQEGQSFESGEWYLSGIYGAAQTSTDPRVFDHPATKATLYASDDTKKELTDVSLVIPWTRIYTKASPHPTAKADVNKASLDKLPATLGRNFELKLKPDGVLMRIRPVSNVIEHVLITGIRLRTQELVMGKHTYEKPASVTAEELTQGARPKVTTVSQYTGIELERINKYQAAQSSSAGKILRRGDYANIELFAWGFPVEGAELDPSKVTGAWIVSQGYNPKDTEASRWTPMAEVIDNGTSSGTVRKRAPEDMRFFTANGNQGIQPEYISSRWGARKLYQLVQKQKYERGKIYLMLPRIESDLQIMERYTHVQDPTSGQRYSVIEIHNPTLRNIDLNEYGIARIAVTGYDNATSPVLWEATFGTTSRPKTDYTMGTIYAFPNVSTPFSAGSRLNDNDIPFENIETFASALVLPFSRKYNSASIGMTIQGSGTMWSDPTIRKDVPQHNVVGSSDMSSYTAQYLDYTTKLGGTTAYDITGATPNILAPGQTMIILSGGYLDASKFTDVSSNKTADNIPTFFADIKKGIRTGFCKYVVAMNNAKDEGAMPLSPDAGVTSFGNYDIPLLFKRRPMPNGSTGFYYQLLDGMWMNKSLAWYFGLERNDKKYNEAAYDVQLNSTLPHFGIVSQYIKAKNRNLNGEHAGLWEKRTPSDLFNMPIVTEWSAGRMTCAQDYAVGQADNFTSFGVRLFQDQTTPRNPANYVVKWSAKK